MLAGVLFGSAPIVQPLIDAGAGAAALSMAAGSGYVHVVRCLLDQGVDVKTRAGARDLSSMAVRVLSSMRMSSQQCYGR